MMRVAAQFSEYLSLSQQRIPIRGATCVPPYKFNQIITASLSFLNPRKHAAIMGESVPSPFNVKKLAATYKPSFLIINQKLN